MATRLRLTTAQMAALDYKVHWNLFRGRSCRAVRTHSSARAKSGKTAMRRCAALVQLIKSRMAFIGPGHPFMTTARQIGFSDDGDPVTNRAMTSSLTRDSLTAWKSQMRSKPGSKSGLTSNHWRASMNSACVTTPAPVMMVSRRFGSIVNVTGMPQSISAKSAPIRSIGYSVPPGKRSFRQPGGFRDCDYRKTRPIYQRRRAMSKRDLSELGYLLLGMQRRKVAVNFRIGFGLTNIRVNCRNR